MIHCPCTQFKTTRQSAMTNHAKKCNGQPTTAIVSLPWSDMLRKKYPQFHADKTIRKRALMFHHHNKLPKPPAGKSFKIPTNLESKFFKFMEPILVGKFSTTASSTTDTTTTTTNQPPAVQEAAESNQRNLSASNSIASSDILLQMMPSYTNLIPEHRDAIQKGIHEYLKEQLGGEQELSEYQFVPLDLVADFKEWLFEQLSNAFSESGGINILKTF
ncbi:hypothetical protein BDR26DRAFT_867029 [Obelidium mucronatum]|nr:hypothetical protein BDR26DRAFT_867029 [Obelidium mucronatum]